VPGNRHCIHFTDLRGFLKEATIVHKPDIIRPYYTAPTNEIRLKGKERSPPTLPCDRQLRGKKKKLEKERHS